MKKHIFQIINIYLLSCVLFGITCQKLDPVSVTKFSSMIEASNVSYNTATVTSRFMDVGGDIIVYGHCWNKSQNPTIDDFKTTFSNIPEKQADFISELNRLSSSTKYYVRAYVITEKDTIYSKEINFPTTVLSDIEGNTYKVVTIGTQIWMAENLKTEKYANGDLIGTTNPATLNISGETNPKYQWAYNGDEFNVIIFGRLYTWYAATDSRKICPTGWHLPLDDEWTTLEIYLQNNGYNCNDFIDNDNDRETNNYIAKSLASTTGWTEYAYEVSVGSAAYPSYRNKSGFTAFPSGVRNLNGAFSYLSTHCVWWSSTEYSNPSAFIRDIVFNARDVEKTDILKVCGNSIRCVKD
jgi:uncharacterized protein (TIGR02145 family)